MARYHFGHIGKKCLGILGGLTRNGNISSFWEIFFLSKIKIPSAHVFSSNMCLTGFCRVENVLKIPEYLYMQICFI